MNDPKVNKLILKSAYITIIILIIAVIALLILKYDVEGEKNMPFKLSSIIIKSNAEGYQEEENKNYKWDVEILQNNEIYLNIEKNKNYKETELIENIIIENIEIFQKPEVGEVKLYKMSEKNVFTYNDEYEIKEKIEYAGDLTTNLNNLKISNQGGTIIISAVNRTGKKYTSNEEQLEHSGKLLQKVGITNEEIKYKIKFDIIIKLKSDISYKSTIKLDLPAVNIIEQGSASTEIKNTRNIVFKRNFL